MRIDSTTLKNYGLWFEGPIASIYVGVQKRQLVLAAADLSPSELDNSSESVPMRLSRASALIDFGNLSVY